MTAKHKPTKASKLMVRNLTAYGYKQAEISSYLGIKEDCLRRHYRQEIDNGALEVNQMVLDNLFTKACSPDASMNSVGIFWAKTRCGWREKDVEDPAATVKAVLEAIRPMDRKDWDKEHGTPV